MNRFRSGGQSCTPITPRGGQHCRPIHNLAQEADGILRYDAAFAPFAAAIDSTPSSLANLATVVRQGGNVILQQDHPIGTPASLRLMQSAATVRMVAERADEAEIPFEFEVLTQADAPDMLGLARLAKPGPFATRTHEMGRFVGLKIDGRLIAMAGERMKTDGFAEVSGVCTHPKHRSNGYAAGLMRDVARAIVSRGETPFLHTFADNKAAIALYERLGYVTRWRPRLMVFERG